ncbi:unnamed protein product, partial [Closterium sp. Naga37s-1]
RGKAFLQPSSSASLLLPRATAGSRVFQRIPAAGKGQVDEWLGELPRGSKREVAVKVLHTESVKAFDDCLAEILVLGDLRHPNLVQLLGYCMEDSRAILVYELVERGDLHHWLHPNGRMVPGCMVPGCMVPGRMVLGHMASHAEVSDALIGTQSGCMVLGGTVLGGMVLGCMVLGGMVLGGMVLGGVVLGGMVL